MSFALSSSPPGLAGPAAHETFATLRGRGHSTGGLSQYQTPAFFVMRRRLAAICHPKSAEVGGVALAIDAKDTQTASWYECFGAIGLLGDPLKLILPLTVIAEAITAAQKKIR